MKKLTAKQSALKDIKEELKAENKCFIAFHTELNPIMRQLVHYQLKQQRKLK